MKCEKCGRFYESGTFCSACGGRLIVEKRKFSAMTIACLVNLILVIAIPIGMSIYAMIEGANSGNDAYGWFIFVILMTAFLVVPYYIALFFASLVCDKKVKKNKEIKNIILIFFLILPIIVCGLLYYNADKDSKKLSYEYADMSLTFPEGMKRISTATDINNKYTSVEFTKDNCTIEYSVSKYRNELSLMENLKEISDRFMIIDNNPNTIYHDFDNSILLKSENINGKSWNLYEKNYNNLNYKLYGTKINDNFYKIEIKDKNSSICTSLKNEVFNTVKYK